MCSCTSFFCPRLSRSSKVELKPSQTTRTQSSSGNRASYESVHPLVFVATHFRPFKQMKETTGKAAPNEKM